jgi:glycosyltransferase involved in cell wall biosynthesis
VLVSNRGALPEVVGRRGIVLPFDDPAPWTAAIERVLAQPFVPGIWTPTPDAWRTAAEAQLTVWRELVARADRRAGSG